MAAGRPEDIVRAPLSLSLSEWRSLAGKALKASGRHNLGLIAAGVAFFAVLALFPALSAIVALFGLMGDPQDVLRSLDGMRGYVPSPVIGLVREQMDRLLLADDNRLALHGLVSVLVSLWSAQQGARSFLRALTIVNERGRRRKFLQRYLAAGAITFAALFIALLTIFAFTMAPIVFERVSPSAKNALEWVRTPFLLLVTMASACALYRWGPNRRPPAWRWVAPGALFASVVWLGVSAGFSVYVDLLTPFRAVYGVVSAVFVLMLWLFFSAWIFLVGAELNAQLEDMCSHKASEAAADAIAPSAPP